MTILEPNQPWPQVQVKIFDPSAAVFVGYKFKTVDQSIMDICFREIDFFTWKRSEKPTTLFAGPRAFDKIKECVSQFAKFTNTQYSEIQTREFLGMELILTVDDGLWIA